MKKQMIPSAIKRIPQVLCLLLLTVALASCGGSTPSAAEEGHGHGEEEGHDGGSTVTLSPKQFSAIEGQLGQVESKDLTTALKTTGFLKVPPQNIADVTAAMGGTIRQVLVQEGDHVTKGQALASITDQAIIDLQRDYLDAKAKLVFAKAELERQTDLAGANVSAQKTLQQATAEHASLLAAVNANAELLRLVNIDPVKLNAETIRSSGSIVSPIDGTVAHIAVNVGSKVSGDATMFRVVNNSKLHVDLFLYEQDIAKVKVGQKIDLNLTNLPGKNYTAVVFAIGSAFESETKTIPVHAEITGDKLGLIDGMGVTARIDVGNATTTAVLTEAIVNMEGKDFVFIRTEGEEEHGHGHENEPAHKEEPAHKHAQGDVHDHAKENAAAHAKGEDHGHDHGEENIGEHNEGDGHDHGKEQASGRAESEGHDHDAARGSMTFQRVEVRKGTTDGAYTAVTFLQEVAPNAQVAVGGAYYLIAMMNTSSGHQH
ncbi:MAG TPA: efflux RND transporter periplasmic adaptor subunit [Flavobacteriales bacterium]|nr:efflux RND transporter periplasmic adaptor subunit [Flavobacteriales bacterium]